MAAKTVDEVQAFAHVVENIPKWKQQVEELAAYTTQKTEEFKANYAQLVHQAKPRRMKTISMCSIHTLDDPAMTSPGDDGDDNKDQGQDSDHPPHQSQPPSSSPSPSPNVAVLSPLDVSSRFLLAQLAKGPRPSISIRSGNASGAQKFRSKNMVVIYYDAHVQSEFETLVRTLGSSRNTLRKGKMTYTTTRGLVLPSLRRGLDASYGAAGLEFRSPLLSRSAPKLPTDKTDPAETVSAPSGEAAFTMVDKELEKSQSLCEKAAHSFLREGDCKAELQTVLRSLEQVFGLAEQTLATFEAEKAASTSTEDTANHVKNNSQSSLEMTVTHRPSRDTLNFSRKITPAMILEAAAATSSLSLSKPVDRPTFPSTQSVPLMTEIEVDDASDQSSMELDLSKYRMGRRARLPA